MNKDNIKNLAIVILAAVVVLLLGVVWSLKKANDYRQYAVANNCTWTWMGTYYGDDRDYICK